MKRHTTKTHQALRLVLVLILLLQFGISGWAQQSNDADTPDGRVLVWGNVRDYFNNECLAGVRVDLLSPKDSSIVAADTCRDNALMYNTPALQARIRSERSPEELIYYSLQARPGRYLMRFLCRGYAPKIVSVEVPAKVNGRPLKRWKANDVQLQRVAERTLGEAVVTATKIMMVNKGDTVVFNADYFQLAQGNMLDKLVSMIPGLEIKSGGQIYYQGNLMKSLLVNGKDFFKGDASVALRNLPAYMVNTVNIYHRGNDDDYLKVREDPNEDRSPNTIDIILKKEYNRGWITNYELAAGPALGSGDAWGNKKYLARLFALCFTDRTQLGVVGNFNNVSDTQVASTDGSWSEGWKPENGVTKLALGGVTFHQEKSDKSVKHHVDLKVCNETTDLQSHTSSTTFLPEDDVFRRASLTSHNRRTHYTFYDGFTLSRKACYLLLPFNVEYWDRRSTSHLLSAQFDGDPADSYRGASLDSIFIGPSSQRLSRLLVNQANQQTLAKSRDVNVSYNPYFSIKIPGLEMLWRNRVSFGYAHQSGKTFEHYRLEYARNAEANNLLNRYFDQPSHSLNVSLFSQLTFGETFKSKFWHDILESVSYRYDHRHQSGHRDIYDFHKLPASDQPQDLGGLPSVDNWRQLAINESNSYFQRRTEETHVLTPFLRWDAGKKWGNFTFTPQFTYHHQRYHDTRSRSRADKRYAFFEASARYCLFRNVSSFTPVNSNTLQQTLFIDYNYGCTPPSINYLVDIDDNTDPLRISRGNENLKARRHHEVQLRYTRGRVRNWQWYTTASFHKSTNDLAMGCNYNSQTGVYTYRPENVNGNWGTSVYTSYSLPFGPKKMWNFSTATTWNYLHSVDLLDGQRSTVRNHSLRENLSLQSRFGKVATLTLRANADWNYANSERANYRTRRSWDFQYGPDLSLHLPADLTLSTDFNVYQRAGYDDHSMNDCDLVWNASLGFDFDFRRSSYVEYHTVEYLRTKTRGGTGARPWTLRLTCHDILQQLSNVRRVVNAQGITETRYNAVPAYVMLSISYRFSKTPKKH